ncbi:MAG: fused MFS/spermidine synthase, partial [candidate division NC10 bacterium]|nr:fused MFS/spermidine synthase [candidate division NC10 bacterium]
MLLPTFFLGAVLPVAAEFLTRRARGAGEAVGRLYTANTIGNILGTVVTGLLFIPRFGFKSSMEIGTLLDILAGAALLVLDPRFARWAKAASSAVTAGLVVLYFALYPPLDALALTYQIFRLRTVPDMGGQSLMDNLKKGRVLLFFEEDGTGTVSVDQTLETGTRALRVNGKVDASTAGDLNTQKLVGHFPLLFHAAPRKVMLVGMGSGITAYSALRHPLERLTCVEISPAVVNASRLFTEQNGDVASDGRFKLIIEDARTFLETTRERYDVIISEPSNPWFAGVANLYTRELFETARARLAPGGVM